MSSESNYAGASMMSEGSQASFVVEVTNKIFKDLPLVFFKLQLEGDTILYFCNDFFIEIVKIFALLTKRDEQILFDRRQRGKKKLPTKL